MDNRFYKVVKGRVELNDKEIVKALREAADGYENGEILETADVLWEINEAISAYTNYVDQF